MNDSFTETTTTSWGSRIAGSFKGIIFGIFLFMASFALLWWNEERSVERIRALEEGLNIVIPVQAETLTPAHEGALVHVSGMAQTSDTLKDPAFGVSGTFLKLRRTAEMYQWKENKQTKTTTNTGGSETTETTYSYSKEWASRPINSGEFKHPSGHQNPAGMPYSTQEYTASPITIGAYSLSPTLSAKINGYEPLPLTSSHAAAMAPQARKLFTHHGDHYYHGTPSEPRIGDMRVSFQAISPQTLSAIGKQTGSRLDPYLTKHGELSLLERGTMSAEAMFQSARDENALITWLLRLGGFLLMWIGLGLIIGPLKILADVLPILGSIVGAGVALLTALIALPLTFITIALAWLFFRPLIGITLLVIAGFILFGGLKLLRKKTGSTPPAPTKEPMGAV